MELEWSKGCLDLFQKKKKVIPSIEKIDITPECGLYHQDTYLPQSESCPDRMSEAWKGNCLPWGSLNGR